MRRCANQRGKLDLVGAKPEEHRWTATTYTARAGCMQSTNRRVVAHPPCEGVRPEGNLPGVGT